MGDDAADLTAILNELRNENVSDSAVGRILPLVYEELRGMAESFLRGERHNHTLQPTALVHEAYMRLAGSEAREWTDRKHFFRLAAKTMRHILIDHARAKGAHKRGGDARGDMPAALLDTIQLDQVDSAEILEVDEALKALFSQSPQKAQVVELRFYGGCTIAETAEVLDISTATVERDWRFARAWLKAKLQSDERPAPG